MDPFEGAMRQMQQVADMSEKQALLSKRSAALELARIEGEITIATARVAVADAQIAKLQVQLTQKSDDETEANDLNVLITVSTVERDARLAEIDALKSYLTIKQEIAEIALDIDPNVMNQVVALMASLPDDDSETPSPGDTSFDWPCSTSS